MNDALCRKMDSDLWISEDPRDREKAQEMCLKCPVREQCLKYGKEIQATFGVYGGKDFGKETYTVVAQTPEAIQQRKEIAWSLERAGYTVKQISERLGVSRDSVRNYLRSKNG